MEPALTPFGVRASARTPARYGLKAALHTRPWTGRTRGGVIGNWIFVALVRVFGLRPAYVLLAFVACYYVLFAPRARRASDEYRRRLGCGGRSWLGRVWGAYRHFFSFGRILLDRVAIIAGPVGGKFHFEFDGEEHIRSALAEGKGVVIISAHCGNWEAAGHLLQRLAVPVSVVAYQGEAARVRRFFEKALEDHAFSLIEADGSPDSSLAIMGALARGEVVAMHADRVLHDEGVSVPFLGAPARFPTGPYIVAALSGAALIHAFALREATYRYHFYAYPAEHLHFADRPTRGQLLRDWVGQFVARLESKLREHPHQWSNFYPFWDPEPRAARESVA